MVHHVARTVRSRLLFTHWEEARRLWDLFRVHTPQPVALVLMPDHVHLQHQHGLYPRLVRVARAYAKWLNNRRGVAEPLWEPIPQAHLLADRQKRQRGERYIGLNPTRKALVDDPLAWPYSTHRDATGLTADPIRPRHHRPHDYHRYISSDPSVDIEGTALPCAPARLPEGLEGLYAVKEAISALYRTTEAALARRGPTRTALIASLRCVEGVTVGDICDFTKTTRRTVQRIAAVPDRMVERVLCDPRFTLLHDGDLRRDPRWSPYRNRW